MNKLNTILVDISQGDLGSSGCGEVSLEKPWSYKELDLVKCSDDCEYSILDRGICDFVLLLRSNGFRTFSSCEGGRADHSSINPNVMLLVDLGSSVADTKNRLLDTLLSNGYVGFTIQESHWYSNTRESIGSFISVGSLTEKMQIVER